MDRFTKPLNTPSDPVVLTSPVAAAVDYAKVNPDLTRPPPS